MSTRRQTYLVQRDGTFYIVTAWSKLHARDAVSRRRRDTVITYPVSPTMSSGEQVVDIGEDMRLGEMMDTYESLTDEERADLHAGTNRMLREHAAYLTRLHSTRERCVAEFLADGEVDHADFVRSMSDDEFGRVVYRADAAAYP